MTARDLWCRIGFSTAVAAALLLCVSPAHPERRVPVTLAAFAGVVSGGVLFLVVTRQLPRISRTRVRLSTFLGLLAANEEIVWRRFVLGELLPVGVLGAFALSSFGFALAHRRRHALHLGTGAAFGGVYIATGWLGASIAAHWFYNALVAARAP